VVESRNTLDGLRAKLQEALQEEANFVDKVQQLETDKVGLEARVIQLLGQVDVQGDIGVKLDESKREVNRLQQALEQHEAAASEVRCHAYGCFYYVLYGRRTLHIIGIICKH
jgi:hypothetical protein